MNFWFRYLFLWEPEENTTRKSLASVKPLRAVKDQSDQQFVHSSKMLDYDQHAILVLSAATGYDFQLTSASAKSSRKVYYTELGGSNF